MISKLVTKAALTGLAASLALTAAPALAASAPTLTGPTDRTGFGLITLSGTATPGAAVHLYETAQVFDDLEPADDWEHGGGTLTATADSSGHYSFHRYLDSGFFFQTESGGARSNKITVNIRALPTLTVSSSGSGAVEANVTADPAQPGLPVQLQRFTASGWTTVASGHTDSGAAFAATNSGLYAGTYTFRAYIGADAANGVLANYSSQHTVSVQGATNPNPTPTPNPTPNPTNPTTPTGPAVGSVQFTRIQYNSPGTDTTSTKSLNGEWARVTNKTGSTINLKGWTIRDAQSHVYTFGTTTNLAAGKSLTLYTGKGTNGSSARYWARGYHIWNNTGDTATLRTAAGTTIDTCKWGNGSGATNC